MKTALRQFLIPWLLLVAVFYTSSLHHHHHSAHHGRPCKRGHSHSQQLLQNSATELTDADDSEIEGNSDDDIKIKYERTTFVIDFYTIQNLYKPFSCSENSLVNPRPLYLLNRSLRI